MGNSFFSHLFKKGWPVGNCDFNENPVVYLDLDFDLGFVNLQRTTSGASFEMAAIRSTVH